MSINKLMDELATIAIAQSDAQTHFQAQAAQGDIQRGLAILDKLDAALGASIKSQDRTSLFWFQV